MVVGLSQGGRYFDGARPHSRGGLVGNALVSLASELEIRRGTLIASFCELSHPALHPHCVGLGVRLVPEVTLDRHCIRELIKALPLKLSNIRAPLLLHSERPRCFSFCTWIPDGWCSESLRCPALGPLE